MSEKIALYLDGKYVYTIVEHLKRQQGNSKTISWNGLMEYVKEEIAKKFACDKDDLSYTVPKYFMGVEPHNYPSEARARRDEFRSELTYGAANRSLFDENGTLLVRKGGAQASNGQLTESDFKEKGIDVLLAINVHKDVFNKESRLEAIRHVVLFAGDADFIPLVEAIHSETSVKVTLIYYDFENANNGFVTRASQQLIDDVDVTIDLAHIFTARDMKPVSGSIFKDYGKGNVRASYAPKQTHIDTTPRVSKNDDKELENIKRVIEGLAIISGNNGFVLMADLGNALKQQGYAMSDMKNFFENHADIFELRDDKSVKALSVRVKRYPSNASANVKGWGHYATCCRSKPIIRRYNFG